MNTSKLQNDKIIILDRDGVINIDSDAFIKTPDEWRPITGSIEAISRLYQAGYSIYILSNQSGIARGLFSLDTLGMIHKKLIDMVKRAGGEIAGIYFCPHGPLDKCLCRKPLAGLYDQLNADFGGLVFDGIVSIGDSIRDLQAAKTAGATPVLVTTGKGSISKEILMNLSPIVNTQLTGSQIADLKNIAIYASLSDYAEQLLN